MAASATDKARKTYSYLQKTLSVGIDDNDVVLTPNNVTNVPTDTGVSFVVDRVNSAGTLTPTLRELMTGAISGGTLAGLVRGQHGTTAQSHSAGAVIEFVNSGTMWNDLIDFMLQDHSNPGGNHKTLTDDSGNEWLERGSIASAVNHLKSQNAITATDPSLQAAGGDTNVGLAFIPKGSSGVYPKQRFDGWTELTDSWSYSAWDSTNKTGTITIPAGGATKYSVGMKGRITQSTGGTKYFFITEVNDTTIKGYFGTDYTLNNEAITAPAYSVQKAPKGFPLDPTKWTVSVSSANDRSTTSTTYATLTDAITVPIGLWRVWYRAEIGILLATTPASRRYCNLILSSTGSLEDDNLTTGIGTRIPGAANNDVEASVFAESIKNVAAATTYTLYGKVSTTGPGPTFGVYGSTHSPTIIKAVCAYL